MPEINPLTNNQIFLKKIAENTGSDYETGDVSEINPLTIDQILLKEIAANTAGQAGDITELEEKISATQDMLNDAYDSTHTYNVGDYCIYNNVLYRCKTAIATPEAFTPAKWTATTVGNEIAELTDVVNRGSVSVTADGVKDTGALFDELMALVDKYKLSSTSYVLFGNDCYRWQYTGPTSNISFTLVYVEIDKLYVNTLRYTTGGSAWYEYSSTNGVQNKTSEVLSSGFSITLYY